MNSTIVTSEKNMDRIIRMLGSGHYFKDLEILQMAIDKSGAVPQNFFFENGGCYETWGPEWRSKSELREIREALISAIAKKINDQNRVPYKDKMDADHYARYLHALAILKVDKNYFNKTKHDYMRNAFLELWKLDDGSEENWKIIDSAAWHIAEAVKGIKGLYVKESIYPDE